MELKKLLMFSLAVNSVVASYAGAATTTNYDNLYNNMTKNIVSGKSNDTNYKLIESILKKRNNELKDLYAQSDYIVKPEYLEWQIFFTGFYDHERGGDNTSASGKYHSDPNHSSDGVTGKPFQGVQESRDVDLGIRIPLKDVNKPELNLNVSPTVPVGYAGTIDVVKFELPTVSVNLPTIALPAITPFSFPPTGNGDSSWIAKSAAESSYVGNSGGYSAGDTAPIAQINLNGGTMNVNVNGGLFDLSLANSTAQGVWGASHTVDTSPGVQNFAWTGLNQVAVMKIVGGHDIYLDDLNINFSGTGTSGTPKMLFHIDAHNSYGSSVYHIGSGVNTNITGSNLMYFGVQYHSGSKDAGLIHDGTITTSATGSNNLIFSTINPAGGTNTRNLYFTNNGTITLNGDKEILAMIDIAGGTGFGGDFTNTGTVDINGTNSYGVILTNTVTGLPKITLNTPINVNGTGNVGIGILKEFDTSQSLIKLNANGIDSFGIVANYAPTTTSTLNNYELTTGAASSNSTLVYIQNGNLAFDSTGKATTMAGTNNFGFVAGSGTTLSVDNNISSTGDKNLPLVSDSATVQYAGNITTNGLESHGLVVKGTGTLTNIAGKTVSSIVSGDNSVALYNEGTTTLNDGGDLKSLGNKGTIIFAKGATTVKGANNYEVGTNGIGFYSNGGAITLDANTGTSTIKIGANSIFSYIDGTTTLPAVNFNNGTYNVALDTGATGFIYKGAGSGSITQSTLQTYMNSNYGGLTNLNFNLGADSRLFVLEEYGSIVMSAIGNLSNSGMFGSVTGSGKNAFLWKGNMIVDAASVNLDDPSDPFNKVDRSSVGVTVNAGTTITGTQANQVALADIFSFTPSGDDYREMLNGGTISLTGNNAVGIYTASGRIINNGTVSSTGTNGIGLFGENGTTVLNNTSGIVNVGNMGIGLYGISNQNSASPQGNGNGSVTLTNSGTINTNTGTNAVGMYGITDAAMVGNLLNDTTGIINIGQSSQGMYFKDNGANLNTFINNGQILSSSIDTVGMFLDNSTGTDVTNNGTISLTADKSRGIYVINTGTTNIINSATGNITVGDSSDINDPSLGIYSQNGGDIISNSGNITAGKNSLGIYAKEAAVTHTGGIITVGDNGTGIYGDHSNITISSPASIVLGTNGTAGAYGINGSVITNGSALNVGDRNFGFILQSGSSLINDGAMTLGESSVFAYSNGGASITNNAGGTILMNGSDNIGIYMNNGGTITNNGAIDGTAGIANIGIVNVGGSIINTASIKIGDSAVIRDSQGHPMINSSTYAVGIYGDGANISNIGDITIGKDSIALYAKDAPTIVTNSGNIDSSASGAIGLFVENSTINNTGNVTLSGANSIGMSAVNHGNIINTGTITMNGDNSKGVYLRVGSTLNNAGGTIIINGANSEGVSLDTSSTIINAGTITTNNITSVAQAESGSKYPIPTIINSGVINVNENFKTTGLNIEIKVDPSTVRPATPGTDDEGASFVSDAVKFNSPYFDVDADNPVKVTADFTQGRNVTVYKLKDVFNPITPDGGPNTGIIPVVSKSLTWSATPQINSSGNIDIWMQKIPYDSFTSGLWYEGFGKALDAKYGGATGEALQIFNKMDFIENESDFRRITASLAGNVYSNINQREDDIAKTFENSLNLLQDSVNNTKENVKVNIITGKGSTKEDTDGVVGYDYSTVGVLALREVERTYKNTFGYSLGYLHTGFEFEDGNDSEEWVDTLQLGVHNKYGANGWKLKNDLTGRASIHNVDRNIDWTAPNGRSEMNGSYETYSITSDNRLGKEFELSKNTSFTPYGGFRVMYVTRPTFDESGLERVQVEGNDAWSVKPRAGVELKASIPLGNKTSWALKGALDFGYEYELADLNEREKARLIAVEDGYHDLAKPEDKNGKFTTKAILGAEIQDRYGIFINGEYSIGDNSQEDYRAGVTLKAVF
ncbi:MAG: autotransporter domain-containing protein [Sebaldella sp.]|nr:autotransporter domain-containing protein [Sebaldella sp.]